MSNTSPIAMLRLAALLGALLAIALAAGACGRAEPTGEPQTARPKIGVPFDLQVETGRVTGARIRVAVTPRIEGRLQVLALNEDSGEETRTNPVRAKPSAKVSTFLQLPLEGSESVIKVEIVLTDDAGNRFAAFRRLKVTTVDGDLDVEEIPLAPSLPTGPEQTAEPMEGIEPRPTAPPDSRSRKFSSSISETGVMSPGTVTVSGRWGYEDQGVVFRPLPYARVEIWDSDLIGDDLLCTTYTDPDGYYSCTVDNSDGGGSDGQDIYTRAYTTDDSSVRVTTAGGSVYYGETSVYSDTPDGTLDVGTWVVVGDSRAADYIYDLIADDAWAYLLDEVGWNNDLNLRVNWPDGAFCGTSCYDTVNDQIHLLELDRWDSDVFLHEYGHFVMDQNWAAFPPAPNCNPHGPGMNTSLGCAWTEGWATYLEAAIQNDPVYTDTEDGDISVNFESAPDTWDDPRDEGSVMASLWDIHDPANEAWDAASDGINGPNNNGIWRVSAGTDAVDINDFWSDWQTVNSRILCEVADILIHHGITATPCAPPAGGGGVGGTFESLNADGLAPNTSDSPGGSSSAPYAALVGAAGAAAALVAGAGWYARRRRARQGRLR